MNARDIIRSSPRRLSFGRPGHSYVLADDLVAIHGVVDTRPAVMAFPADGASVHRVEDVGGSSTKGVAGPVYRRAPGGSISVPTGRVLVRFRESELAEGHRENLERVGFTIEAVLPYAPHAVWVRAQGGGIEDALARLRGLQELPGVEAVEAQMLTESVKRA